MSDARLTVTIGPPTAVSKYTANREAEIRADERAKCVAEIRALNASRIGYEWVLGSTWANIIERAAGHIERKGT